MKKARNQILRSPGANRQLFAVGICDIRPYIYGVHILYCWVCVAIFTQPNSDNRLILVNGRGAINSDGLYLLKPFCPFDIQSPMSPRTPIYFVIFSTLVFCFLFLAKSIFFLLLLMRFICLINKFGFAI